MTSKFCTKFCPLIFCLLVYMTSCMHGLCPVNPCAGDPSDLDRWPVRWWSIRFEQMATMLITDCVHTPGDCTRASSRWCALNHPRVALRFFSPLAYKTSHHDDHWLKQWSKSLEEATFSEQCVNKSVRDDYFRLFSQLDVRKYLSFVFLRSHLKGLF